MRISYNTSQSLSF